MNFRHIAIANLRPKAEFSVRGNEVIWNDSTQTEPSTDEIEAEIMRLQTEYNNRQFQRDRAREYPSFADQFDLLYHGGYGVWKAKIDEIKNKYPKPESM